MKKVKSFLVFILVFSLLVCLSISKVAAAPGHYLAVPKPGSSTTLPPPSTQVLVAPVTCYLKKLYPKGIPGTVAAEVFAYQTLVWVPAIYRTVASPATQVWHPAVTRKVWVAANVH